MALRPPENRARALFFVVCLIYALAALPVLATRACATDECCGEFIGLASGVAGEDFGDQPFVQAGCYTGNGLDNRAVTTGFSPGFVMLAEFAEDPANDTVYRTLAHDGDFSCDMENNDATPCAANKIQEFTEAGFVVGTSAKVNTDDRAYCYIAIENRAGFTEFGTYVGDGTDDHHIPVGFTPDVMLVNGRTDLDGSAYFKTVLMTGNSMHFRGTSGNTYVADAVKSFDLPGAFLPTASFTLGTNTDVNTDGTVYDYMAFNDVANWIHVFQATGPAFAAIDPGCAAGIGFGMIVENRDNAAGASCKTWNVRGADGPDTETSRGWRDAGLLEGGFVHFNATDLIEIEDGGVDNLRCNANATQHDGFVICLSDEFPELTEVAAPDWTSSFRAVHNFEEAANTTAVNATGALCGADCDLTDNSSNVGRSTVEFRQGLQSAVYTSSTSEFHTCAAATCETGDANNDFEFDGTEYTIGCWGRHTNAATSHILYGAGNDGTDDDPQWRVGWNTTNKNLACRHETNTPTTETANSANSSWPDNTWAHGVCRWSGTLLQAFIDGASSGSAVGASSIEADVTGPFRAGVSDKATPDLAMVGEVDECFAIADSLPAADICRIFSCGIDGALCTCAEIDETVYVNSGRNNGCALPVCNKAAPG